MAAKASGVEAGDCFAGEFVGDEPSGAADVQVMLGG